MRNETKAAIHGRFKEGASKYGKIGMLAFAAGTAYGAIQKFDLGVKLAEYIELVVRAIF